MNRKNIYRNFIAILHHRYRNCKSLSKGKVLRLLYSRNKEIINKIIETFGEDQIIENTNRVTRGMETLMDINGETIEMVEDKRKKSTGNNEIAFESNGIIKNWKKID